VLLAASATAQMAFGQVEEQMQQKTEHAQAWHAAQAHVD
jgi:hypothetical protein